VNDYIRPLASLDYEKIQDPQFVFRPAVLNRAAAFFAKHFRGDVLYAVKTNPERHILSALRTQGISSFEVASLWEIELIRSLEPNAKIYFMNPVKSRNAIREAYFSHGVRHFSLDTEEELQKIQQETQHATDLGLHLRLSIPNTYSKHKLSGKFGIAPQDAPNFLRTLRRHAHELGICFHVGSQCMHPIAYQVAIRMAGEIINQAGVYLEYFNVGGGFPSVYPGMTPPPLKDYFDVIHEEFNQLNQCRSMKLIAEPGRALVAESTSVIVRVELKKYRSLYINDGTYGSLFDAGAPRFKYPVRLLRFRETHSSGLVPYSFYGPTCDSLDYMKGPFYLPKDVQEGDYIEIGQMGAYGRTMSTLFNGFRHAPEVLFISDEPLMTMYNDSDVSTEFLEGVAA